MLRRLAMTTLALTLFAGSMLSTTVAANAAVSMQGSVVATTPAPEPSNPSGPSTATPTAEPTSDAPNPAGTGPANPGTGESGQQEQTRTDVVPWILAAVAAAIIMALILLTIRNRRGRDKGIRDEQR